MSKASPSKTAHVRTIAETRKSRGILNTARGPWEDNAAQYARNAVDGNRLVIICEHCALWGFQTHAHTHTHQKKQPTKNGKLVCFDDEFLFCNPHSTYCHLGNTTWLKTFCAAIPTVFIII